ncbi:ABC transporter C family member 4-like [Apium graveolens]|uniref:ABC transporter C family member 4-like n=1 Tax=Apium graveolens TaxID=4045 RepID=UPI003D7AD2A3
MSLPSWLNDLECSASTIQFSQWLGFIFLSPCSQRILFSSIDLVFLLSLFVFGLQKLCSRFMFKRNINSASINEPLLEETNKSSYTVTLWFKLTVVVACLLSIAYTVLCVLSFIRGVSTSWKLIEGLFWLVQALTFLAISVLVAHEKKVKAVVHPISLRLYWIAHFVIVVLFAACAIIRLVTKTEYLDEYVMIDDILFLVSFPFSAFLFVVAIYGSSGISIFTENGIGPNLVTEQNGLNWRESNVSGYANASLLSRGTWYWMNPLITKGYESPLALDDVPTLPADHKAQRMADLFEMNWPKEGENLKNPVRDTLIRCFWKQIAFTALLSLLRLSVMYIGPMLIQNFVDYTSGDRSNPFEGYYLISILFLAKIIEVLSSHQFNFQCARLGMLIRSSLITSLYKKGLRLSCSSRQDHGVGQIVNHMAVDAQQLSDMMPQLHPIWMTPLQIGVALFLLYSSVGLSVIAAIITVIGTMFFTLWITRKNNKFQYHIMRNKDSRMKATNEMLGNMRVIKFQAWEEHFNKRIQTFRDLEYGWLSKFMYAVSTNMVVLWNIPIIMAVLTFGLALWLNVVRLDAGTVFTATTIFRILQEPIRTFPQALISVSQAMVSLGRLDGFMTSKELENSSVERVLGCGGRTAVEVNGGNFSWDDKDGIANLKDVNITIKKGELAAIVGTVGSGKSSLLASILGEMHKISGEVRVCGTTSYVAQTSWIQNATIEENILFGSPMNRKMYEEVLRVCCLQKDMEIMEHGDQTEIGERGINLSGGQKQRIQLARAVYQDCDIYLLDDVFSAVDAETGSEIFKECVRGALRYKTVLLVTHQVDFLHNADLILVMRDGKIVESGRYEPLLKAGLDFGALVAAHETSMELVETSTTVACDNSLERPKSPLASSSPKKPIGENGVLAQSNSKKGNSKLIEEEERESGQVSFGVYKQYFTEAFGWWGVAGVLLISLLWQGSTMGSDYWLAYETSADRDFIPSLFITVYAIFGVVSCVFVLGRAFFVTYLGLKTTQSFFHRILHSILHAPMSFFDTTPSGRILSRASSDQANIDFLIPFFLSMTIAMYFSLLGVLVITCQYAWPTVFCLVPLIWLNIWYRGYYLASSRELTRLDQITKAPVIHHFSETISGVMTIRCFRKQGRFIQENIDKVNANLRMDFHNNGSNEWLGFRLELMGCLVLCVSASFLILLPSTIIKPENVGLTLSYGLSLNGVLFWTVYLSCFVENRMVSVERIKQFISIPSEAEWKMTESLPSPDWPNSGNIDITNLQVRYRSNTPLVLKGITLGICGGDKIGVVGRTGSGKSTLIQVFFRLVEPCGGKIIIDGLDICKLGLHDLRSRFGIIPQDPVLFQGTVRSNIDPIGLYSDEDIWKSLERCQLKDVVAEKPEKLDAPVVDSGDNWSVGQRQLLCLGRVMLKHSKILFMDEATASVDSQTDAIIQKIIREEFKDCTIITIAHRIPTVIDCDKVLVIDAGLAKEYDAPSKLLERPSLFAALVQEYSNRSSGL